MSELRTVPTALLRQALEALKSVQDHKPNDETNAAITALRAALAQQAEPVESVAEPFVVRHHDEAAAELRRLSEIETLYLAAMRGRNAMSEELLAVTTQRDALLEALKMVRKTVEENEQGVSGEANYTHSYKVWTEAVREAIALSEVLGPTVERRGNR